MPADEMVVLQLLLIGGQAMTAVMPRQEATKIVEGFRNKQLGEVVWGVAGPDIWSVRTDAVVGAQTCPLPPGSQPAYSQGGPVGSGLEKFPFRR